MISTISLPLIVNMPVNRKARVSTSVAISVAGLLLSATAFAQAEIYRCENESGVPLYQNVGGKNCKKLDLAPLTSIPAPKLPAAAKSSGASPAVKLSPEGFPRVEPATQAGRDSDRRRIIEEELKKEESKLSELKKDFNSGEPERRGDERNAEKYQQRVQKMKEDIARGESSVGSLRRELALIKG